MAVLVNFSCSNFLEHSHVVFLRYLVQELDLTNILTCSPCEQGECWILWAGSLWRSQIAFPTPRGGGGCPLALKWCFWGSQAYCHRWGKILKSGLSPIFGDFVCSPWETDMMHLKKRFLSACFPDTLKFKEKFIRKMKAKGHITRESIICYYWQQVKYQPCLPAILLRPPNKSLWWRVNMRHILLI